MYSFRWLFALGSVLATAGAVALGCGSSGSANANNTNGTDASTEDGAVAASDTGPNGMNAQDVVTTSADVGAQDAGCAPDAALPFGELDAAVGDGAVTAACANCATQMCGSQVTSCAKDCVCVSVANCIAAGGQNCLVGLSTANAPVVAALAQCTFFPGGPCASECARYLPPDAGNSDAGQDAAATDAATGG
jgi:hypothetical protein